MLITNTDTETFSPVFESDLNGIPMLMPCLMTKYARAVDAKLAAQVLLQPPRHSSFRFCAYLWMSFWKSINQDGGCCRWWSCYATLTPAVAMVTNVRIRASSRTASPGKYVFYSLVFSITEQWYYTVQVWICVSVAFSINTSRKYRLRISLLNSSVLNTY